MVAKLFEDEKAYPDNRPRENFVFFGYPFTPPLAREDYAQVLSDLEGELGLRLWYFLDEMTTTELIRKVWRAILRCDLAIFDVSGGNPNVAFELGMAAASNRPCMTMLKTGEANPLGGADLSYAERVEYTSVTTLKEKLRTVLKSKTTAARRSKEVAFHIYESGKPLTHDNLQEHVRSVLKVVYLEKKINKSRATQIFGDRAYADTALSKLRELNILKMEGQKKGAVYVFSDNWVYHDHEVTGV